MRVLDPPDDAWVYRTTCRVCKTRLELEPADLKPKYNCASVAVFICPRCKKDSMVEIRDLPGELGQA